MFCPQSNPLEGWETLSRQDFSASRGSFYLGVLKYDLRVTSKTGLTIKTHDNNITVGNLSWSTWNSRENKAALIFLLIALKFHQNMKFSLTGRYLLQESSKTPAVRQKYVMNQMN